MSEKTIRVKKEENRLLVYYSPSINFDEVVRNIAYGTLIKGTFWVTQDNLVEVNEEEEYICFRIADRVPVIQLCRGSVETQGVL